MSVKVLIIMFTSSVLPCIQVHALIYKIAHFCNWLGGLVYKCMHQIMRVKVYFIKKYFNVINFPSLLKGVKNMGFWVFSLKLLTKDNMAHHLRVVPYLGNTFSGIK